MSMNRKAQMEYNARLMSADEAVNLVKSGDRVYLGTASSVAYVLDDALAKREDINDLTVLSAFLVRPSKLIDSGRHKVMSYFMGPQERKALKMGIADYTSFSLDELQLWADKLARPDVVLLEVSPPDEYGFMSYGATGSVMHEHMKEAAQTVILQVNKQAPYVYGEHNKIHCTEADAIVETDDPLGEMPEPAVSEEVQQMCRYIMEEIHDGDTIQLGTGRIATALGYMLKERNDLGIHTEIMGDSIMELMKSGNVTNARKTYKPGKSVVGFCYGSRKLYDYIDHNPDFHFMPLTIINRPDIIAKNDNMISINNALTIDLTGQVMSEGMSGFNQHSGIGGQVDYVRGAQMAKGGKSFIVAESTFHSKKTGKSGSHIVCTMQPGDVVTTPRCDVQYVVTEYGCVNLKELTMKERVRAMISLAHPDFRDQLTEEAKQYRLL